MREVDLTNSRIDKTIHYGSIILKIAQVASIVCLTISTILLIWYVDKSANYTWYFKFIWNSLLSSIWILIWSPVYFLMVAIYGQLSQNRKLNSLTSQFVLFLITIFVAGVFVVTAFKLEVL